MPILPRVRRRLRDWWRGETDATFFDIHDLDAVNGVLEPRGVAPLIFDLKQAETDVAGAARLILAALATYGDLRRQFPTALSDGPDGPFARWLKERPTNTRRSPTVAANITAAFDARLGEKGKRVYEVRHDLRAAIPFGQTPHPHRAALLGWMVTHGAADLGLTPEEALWFLFERDEAPDRGLAATYLVRPDWQEAVPHALTPSGWLEFVRYLRTTYGLAGRWLDRARLDPAAIAEPATQPGVNVLAHFRYASGLQEAAFAIVKSLNAAGVRTSNRDLPVFFESDWRDRERYQGVERFDTTLYVAAVNTLPSRWYPEAGLWMRPGVRRIAVWYWELEDLPPEWIPNLRWPDEVWAPTRFIADAFRKHLAVPVVPMLPGVSLPPVTPKPRSHFGLPDDRVLFLFTFDMGSVMERKNPLGLIAAFRTAFRSDDRAHLAIKVSRGASDPQSFARLRAAASDSGVTLIDKVMSREDALALLNAADCYASLHRSEGLGLGMAECMLLGKPVVATGYSGNLDFMTPDVAHLIDYRRVTIDADATEKCPYPRGSHWADPSVEHAAELMRAVYDRPDDARAMGERARRHVAELLAPEAAARRMVARLEEIGAIPPL